MISVIIPTYNRENTITDSIKSVLNQSIENIEILVIDDGSTDNTRNAVLQLRDDRIRYIYQDNMGACAARNTGIRNALGDYIAFHDSDDIWHKDKLERQLSVVQHNDADIVICKMNHIKNNKIAKKTPKWIKEGEITKIVDLFGVGTQTIFGKKEIISRYEFDESLPRYQDFDYILRLASECKVYCMNEALVDYIATEESISSNPAKLIDAISILLNKYPEFVQNYPTMALHMKKNLIAEVPKSLKMHLTYKKVQKELSIPNISIAGIRKLCKISANNK